VAVVRPAARGQTPRYVLARGYMLREKRAKEGNCENTQAMVPVMQHEFDAWCAALQARKKARCQKRENPTWWQRAKYRACRSLRKRQPKLQLWCIKEKSTNWRRAKKKNKAWVAWDKARKALPTVVSSAEQQTAE